ncbi:MAG: prepilin-type N-terminal cleavage/methylation domain-containing protein [Verrucomicrobiales bacterium]|nr:prepilin-type N-terminal cleavage/methylation domain-containing protein [Verrucomicrobiales bacterium]
MRSAGPRGFSVIELLVAFTVLSILMTILLAAVPSVTSTWIESERRIETYQRARGALELLTRELTPAVVDTRMQFIVLPGEELLGAGALNVASLSPALFWMAPLGEGGELRCVGYYLFRDEEKGFFRLKRVYIEPDNPDGYFPRLVNLGNTRDLSMRTDPVTARWFLDNLDLRAFDEQDPDNDAVVVSTAADGVVAFWVQCYDLLGNPVPWLSEVRNHPSSDLIYNSAAFFQMATTTPFESGETTEFLRLSKQVMKANRVPAEIEISIVTIDTALLARDREIPPMDSLLVDGKLDMDGSVQLYLQNLEDAGIRGAEVFTTRVKLVNGT